ncbi:MAG: type II secretion system F family protein [Acidobacteriota bacterium]
MPEFRVKLASASGEIVERDYTARDAEALRADLERQEYLVLSIRRRSAVLSLFSDLFRRRRRISAKEFLLFNQEFAALVRAGLPIIECIELLLERRKNPDFRALLEDVRDRVRAGESLSDAFAAQEGIPPLYSSTLASGERSGEIASVIDRYVKYAQTIINVRKRVTSAMVYPAILIVLAVAIVLILLLHVLPSFQPLFADLGADLPLLTIVVVGISEFMRDHWLAIVALLAGLIVALLAWRRTPTGQRVLERMLYRVPFVGRIARAFVLTRFARTMGTLVAGGIPLVTSLEVVSRAIGTPVYFDAVRRVEDRIREGAALWDAMDESGMFPDLMIEMVKVGESSGSLAEMMGSVADFTDQEIENDLQTLVSMIEPVLLLFMAGVVATIVLSIFLPLLKLYSATSTL